MGNFMYRLGICFRLGCLCFALFLSSACIETRIPPPQLTEAPKKEKQQVLPQAHTAALRINWRGKDLNKRGWLKALSISRLFYSKINNQSGSLQELLAPALGELLERKGFKNISTAKANSQAELSKHDGYVLDIQVKRHLLLWLPPVEFIQTPRPRRRGKVLLDFLIITQLFSPQSHSAKESNFTSPQVLWTRSFQKKESLAVFPGNEKEALEVLAHRTLSDYLQEIASLGTVAK